MQKLKIVKKDLQVWNKHTFGDLKLRKKVIEQQLGELQKNLDKDNCSREKKIMRELEMLEEQEQIMWMQKSRTNWIIQGDRNTKYYHTVTARRRLRNRITRILNEQGLWVQRQ